MNDYAESEGLMEGFTEREMEAIGASLSDLTYVLIRREFQFIIDYNDSYSDEDIVAFKHILDLIGEY